MTSKCIYDMYKKYQLPLEQMREGGVQNDASSWSLSAADYDSQKSGRKSFRIHPTDYFQFYMKYDKHIQQDRRKFRRGS